MRKELRVLEEENRFSQKMNKNTHSKKYDYPVFKWAIRIILFLIFTSIVVSIFQPERQTMTTENKPSHPTDIEKKHNDNEAEAGNGTQNNSNSKNENLDNADKQSSALYHLFHPDETERVQSKPQILRDQQNQSISDTTTVAKGSVGGNTWKTVGEIISTGKDTKSIWIEIRYERYPGYYQRELHEVDCAKRLIRSSQGGTYTDDGKLVKSLVPDEYEVDEYDLSSIPQTPLGGIFNALCGKLAKK